MPHLPRAGHCWCTGLMAIVVARLLLSHGLPDVDTLWTAVALPTGRTPPRWRVRDAEAPGS